MGTSLPGSSSFAVFIYFSCRSTLPLPSGQPWACITWAVPSYLTCHVTMPFTQMHKHWKCQSMCEVCFQFRVRWICSSYRKTRHAAHLFINEWADMLLLNAAAPGLSSSMHSEGTTPMDKEPLRAGVFCYRSSCLAMVHWMKMFYGLDIHSTLNSSCDFCSLWPLLN